MKTLLDEQLAPITFSWGFFELPLESVMNGLVTWRRGIYKDVATAPVQALLREALRMLEPLSSLPRRELLIATKSPWTAYFDNSLSGGDPFGPASYLAKTLGCRSLALTMVRNTVLNEGDEKPGMYGMVQLELFGPAETEWLNYERAITAGNDGGKWVFRSSGTPLPFEKLETYRARRIQDRFTSEILEEYCAHLGLDIFNEDFYGPDGALVLVKDPLPENHFALPLSEARKRYGL